MDDPLYSVSMTLNFVNETEADHHIPPVTKGGALVAIGLALGNPLVSSVFVSIVKLPTEDGNARTA